MQRLRSLYLVPFLLWTVGAQAETGVVLEDFAFWQQMVGCWEGDNTYFDSDMNYLVRSYSSLVCIELDGREFREVEHRFYPAGLSTSRYGQGMVEPGEGIEVVVTTTGSLADDAGTLGGIAMDQPGSSGPNVRYRLLGPNDGVRTNTNPETGVDVYRMYFNFITKDRRLRSNVAIHGESEDVGSLRAFILYREHRIEPDTFAARRTALRSKHNVKLINVADPDRPGQSQVKRLDELKGLGTIRR